MKLDNSSGIASAFGVALGWVLALAGGAGATQPKVPLERMVRFHPEHRTTSADRGSWITPAAISADGRRSIFISAATNLIGSDSNGREDVFLFDADLNEVRRVFEQVPNRYSFQGDPLINAEGTYAFLSAYRQDDDPSSEGRRGVISRLHLDTGAIVHVPIGMGSGIGGVSANGRYVAFLANSADLVPGFSDGSRQAYLLDFADGSISPISQVDGSSVRHVSEVGLSGDGNVACFASGPTDLGVFSLWISELDTGHVETVPSEVQDGPDLVVPHDCQLNYDGRFIAFVDSYDFRLAYRRDRASGQTALISRQPDGEIEEIGPLGVRISDSGLDVAFTSFNDDPDGSPDVDSLDLHLFQEGTPIRKVVSLSGDWAREGYSLSGDGRFMLVSTISPLQAPANAFVRPNSQVYRVSIGSGDLVKVSDSRTGIHVAEPHEGNPHGTDAQRALPVYLSSAGDRMVFTTSESRTYFGPPGQERVVVMRDVLRDESVLVSEGAGGQAMAGEKPAISPDGRFVAFMSAADILGNGAAIPTTQLYLRDLTLGTTRLISMNADGVPGNGPTLFAAISEGAEVVAFGTLASNLGSGEGVRIMVWRAIDGKLRTVGEMGQVAPHHGLSLSRDGSLLAFSSSLDDLVAGDTHEGADVFLYHVPTSMLTRIDAPTPSFEYQYISPTISGDGRIVAFNQADRSGKFHQVIIHDVSAGTIRPLGYRQFSDTIVLALNHDGTKIAFRNEGALVNANGAPLHDGMAVADVDSGQGMILDAHVEDHVEQLSGQSPAISGSGEYVAFYARSGAFDREYWHGGWVLHRAQLIPRLFADGFEADLGKLR